MFLEIAISHNHLRFAYHMIYWPKYCTIGFRVGVRVKVQASASSIPARGRFRVVVHRSNNGTVRYRTGIVPCRTVIYRISNMYHVKSGFWKVIFNCKMVQMRIFSVRVRKIKQMEIYHVKFGLNNYSISRYERKFIIFEQLQRLDIIHKINGAIRT